MQVLFEIEFKDAKQARQALRVVHSKKDKKASLQVKTVPRKQGALRYTIIADSFTSLRAHATSLLRDLKVLKDTFDFKK